MEANKAMNVEKTIAKNLKQIRTSRKLGQVSVARFLGVTQAAISKYESGKLTPSVDVLYLYAKKFDVSLDYIFGLTASEKGGMLKPEFIQGLSIADSEALYGNPDAPGVLDMDALKKLIDERIAESKKSDDEE